MSMMGEETREIALNLSGQVVDGRYEVREILGHGGMGTVYLARHATLDKMVALKTIHPKFAGVGELSERFAREAMATAKLEHPNVASAMDYGRLPDGGAYLVVQLVRGPSLYDLIQRDPIPWPRATAIAAQIADALAAAHAAGIIHRDLKPDNIHIETRHDGSDLVKVLDFGIARMAGEEERQSDFEVFNPDTGEKQLTRIGTVMGTPGYMAPEQATGDPLDGRADLYALGVILWEMVTQRSLFDADALAAIVTQQLAMDRPPAMGVVSGDPTVPVELQDVVDHLLKAAPHRRPHSAGEVRDALRRITLRVAVETQHGPPTGEIPLDTGDHLASQLTGASFAIERTERVVPWKPILAIGMVMLIAIGAFGAWWFKTTSEAQAEQQAQAQAQVEEALRVGRAQARQEELNRLIERLLESEHRDERRLAGERIVVFEPADMVPEWIRAAADLERLRGCGNLTDALARIRNLGDARLRPVVERYNRRPRTGCGRRRRSDCIRCIRDDLRETLGALPESAAPKEVAEPTAD